jgi:hypothetical protein
VQVSAWGLSNGWRWQYRHIIDKICEEAKKIVPKTWRGDQQKSKERIEGLRTSRETGSCTWLMAEMQKSKARKGTYVSNSHHYVKPDMAVATRDLWARYIDYAYENR